MIRSSSAPSVSSSTLVFRARRLISDVASTPDEIRQALLEITHTRIPVAAGSVENIVGVIQTPDALAAAVNRLAKSMRLP